MTWPGPASGRSRAGGGRLSSFDLLPRECEDIVVRAAGELAARERTQLEIYKEFTARCERLMADHRGEIEFAIPSFSLFNPYSRTVNGQTTWASKYVIQLWRGGTKLRQWGFHFKAGDSESDPRTFTMKDDARIEGTVTYYLKIHRPADGAEADFLQTHLRVGQKKR